MQLEVKYVPGNNKFCVVGGGLPRGTAWSEWETQEEALTEAMNIAKEMYIDTVVCGLQTFAVYDLSP